MVICLNSNFWENNCIKTRSLNIPDEIDLLENYLWDFVSETSVINLDLYDTQCLADFAIKNKNCTVTEIYCNFNHLETILGNQDSDYQFMLFYIYLTEDMGLLEVEEISSLLLKDAPENIQVIWGIQVDPTLAPDHIIIKYAACKNGVES